MFIQVRLLTGFAQPLWYQVPTDMTMPIIGSLVEVPVRNKNTPAVVIQNSAIRPSVHFDLKFIDSSYPFPSDGNYYSYLENLSNYYQIETITLIKRMRHFLESEPIDTIVNTSPPTQPQEVTLTQEQQTVCDFLLPLVREPRYAPTVLHGVTGSGKTEIYKMIMQQAWELNKTTLLLLPEVTLALAFQERLRAELPSPIPICGFHSATTPAQKKILWHHLQHALPCVIIGVHLPILLPIPHLAAIIVDEEHEIGYQEKKYPKINTKEAAIMRAHAYHIPIILGSATPSLTTLYNVKTRNWHFFQLKKRFGGEFPTVTTIALTDKKQRRNFWISQPLYDAIKQQLANKKQTIIFLNRRGFSFFVQCTGCSFTFTCPSCSVSLTLHMHNQLLCHYCGHTYQLPSTCPSCTASQATFIKKGIGTQQVVSILENLFPTARIARADLDTTKKKKEWHRAVDAFTHGDLDILVGTQTITKGYHFPQVTLVGIIWADLHLNFPFYNAAESTLQQLIQVAGRAGRQSAESRVIVQTMAQHDLFNFLHEVDYLRFYEHEIHHRELLGYPPTQRLAELEIKHTLEETVTKESQMLVQALRTAQQKKNLEVQILGPAQPPVFKVKNTFSKKIYLKAHHINYILVLIKTIKKSNYHSTIFYTPNPVT